MDTDSSATDTTEAMTVETPDEEEEDTGYANVHTNSNCTTDAFEEQEMKEEPQPVQKKRRYSRNNNVWMTRVNRKKRRTAPKATPVAKSPESPKTDQQDGEEYEVETIVDHKVEDGEEFYLVKWKGWSEEYDEWLKKEHLNCPDLLGEFHSKNPVTADLVGSCATDSDAAVDPEVVELQKYVESIFKPTAEDIEKTIRAVCQQSETKGRNNASKIKTEDDLQKLGLMVFRKRQNLARLEHNLMLQLLARDFRKRRAEQLFQLADWERQINAVTQGKPSIRVENYIDLDEPPLNFTYINECKAGPNVTIPDDPLIGCSCTECNGQKTCCGPMSLSEAAYTKAGRIKVAVGTPVYECNSRCPCSQECPNRVVQRGSKLKLCIFRTANGRGWGVKTLETIRRNAFVIEYVGEIVTNEEAERRGVHYDAEGRTYLFDLDFNDADCAYSIDAAREGNISHFINHSCDPNLSVYAVWANCMDPNMPRLAFFAQRDIHSGEELTFDYASSKMDGSSSAPSTSASAASASNQCRCGAAACRKILFSLPESQSQTLPPFPVDDVDDDDDAASDAEDADETLDGHRLL